MRDLYGISIAREFLSQSLSGFTIAFLIQSVDHSLSTRLILIQSLDRSVDRITQMKRIGIL